MTYHVPNDVSKEAVRDAINAQLGVVTQAQAGTSVIEHDASTGTGILRVATDMADVVRTALTLTRYFDGRHAQPRIVGVSGTLATARERDMEG